MQQLTDDLAIYTGHSGTGQKITTAGSPSSLVEGWLLDVPGWSPAWQHFMVSVIHLRDDPDLPPAHKTFPEATHELVVRAMDSTKLPVPSDPETWVFLSPANVVVQFACDDDRQAAIACRTLAAQAVNGRQVLEPHGVTGARELWVSALKNLLPPGATVS